jgi:hypothetical protein
LAGRLFGRSIIWPVDYLAGRLFGRSIIWPVDYLVGQSFGRSIIWAGHFSYPTPTFVLNILQEKPPLAKQKWA